MKQPRNHCLLPIALALLAALPLRAEERRLDPVRIDFEARGSYHLDYVGREKNPGETGFRGDLFNFVMWGDLAPGLEYKARVRLNGLHTDYSFFDATDWLYIAYRPTERLQLIAGKWVVFVGGWETDLAPIDCFQLSLFLHHFPCYAWGVTGIYDLPSGQDSFGLQLCESPYRRPWQQAAGQSADMYALNLFWQGDHGFYQSVWSANLIEYEPEKYINYLYLGNRFRLSPRTELDFDFGNRAVAGQRPFFFSDFSTMVRLKHFATDRLRLVFRAGYDRNHSGLDADSALRDGTKMAQAAVGLEYYPYRDSRLRLHGNLRYAYGTNTHPEVLVQGKELMLDLGLTWRINVK